MHGSGEFLVTDRYGETVPEPFGVVRRNDFIRSRSQDAVIRLTPERGSGK